MTLTASMSIGMRSPMQRPKPALLGLFWMGIQMVWGALLGVSLQSRASQLVPHQALAAYGMLAITGACVAAVTQIVIGIISDRRRAHGSRRVEFYAAGSIAAVFALIWFYTAPIFSQLIAALVLLQVGMNVAIGPYQAVIPDFVSDERIGTASSWMAALQSVGNAAGAMIAGLISNGRAVALALAGALIFTGAGTAAHVTRLTLLPANPQPLRITRPFVDLFISRALMYVGFYTLLGYLYFYVAATMTGDPKTLTGIVLLTFTSAGALGALAAALPVDRIDRRAVATFGGALFVTALGLFLISHVIGAVIVSALIAGAAWGVFLTADWALGCRFVPRHALATSLGVWNLALLIPQIAAPLIATSILSASHMLHSSSASRIAFVVAAVEVACGIAWIWRLPAFAGSVETLPGGNTA
jgi:MFS family permease